MVKDTWVETLKERESERGREKNQTVRDGE